MNKQKLHTGTTRHPVPARAELHGCDQGKEKKWTERTLSVPPDPLLLNSATLPLAEWNGLKAACRTPALQSTSSACVSEAMRAGWDGVTVRAVYMTLFLHLCTYSNTMQISGYKSLLRTVWYFSYEFWSIYINNTYQNKSNCLNKTKSLKNNLF